MPRRLLVGALLFSGACAPAPGLAPADEKPDADVDTDSPGDTDSPADTAGDTGGDTPACFAEIEPTCAGVVEADPANATVGVSPLAELTWSLELEDPEAWASVDGVSGTSRVERDRVVFVPDQPLPPGVEHVARVCWCGGEEVTRFVTADPPAVADPAALVERTWAASLEDAQAVAPAGLGATFQQVYPRTLLFQVRQLEGEELRIRLAWDDLSEGIAQDTSHATLTLNTTFGANPSFRALAEEPWDTSAIGAFPMEAYDLRFAGTWSPDGTRLTDGTLSWLGEVDLWVLVFDKPDAAAFCSYIETFGDHCEACPDGRNECLRFSHAGITATEVTPLELEGIRY